MHEGRGGAEHQVWQEQGQWQRDCKELIAWMLCSLQEINFMDDKFLSYGIGLYEFILTHFLCIRSNARVFS
jgi:hypothetical protein